VKKFIRVMKALSDPNRVKIVKLLGEKELCVCEITALLGLAQPTVSRHLKILEDGGLVESWKDGSWVNYRISKDEDSEYAAAMLVHLREWLDDDKELTALRAKLPEIDRARICAA
jgi:ArsR family transcriptional regulator